MIKRRILIIDDEAHFTRILKMNLEKTGLYEVREENKGALGLATARAFKPDLILLDLMMPDADGAELARELKEDGQTAKIPVLFLTALATQGDTRSGGMIGGRPFVTKSAPAEEISRIIAKHLPSA